MHIAAICPKSNLQEREAMADKNCKETPFADPEYENNYMELQRCGYQEKDQHENNYMELQRCGYQENETATGADAVDGDDYIKITPESRKRCLRAVAFVAVVMVLVMTTAAFALAMLNYKNSTSGELTDKVNQLANESQRVETELTNEFNFLSRQLNQLRNETKLAEEELKSEYNIINGQLDQLRNETKLAEEELKSEYNIINGQLDQLRNESQETERELTNDINLLKIQHQQLLSSTRDNISQVVVNLNKIMNYLLYYDQGRPNCGAGLWYRVAFLNMSDPSQQCPSAWRLVTTNGVRACGRPVSLESSCNGTLYSATSEYQRVCGRVIGYQDKSPDGFSHLGESGSINESYLDGVSITYGQPRNHIWSYVAGVTERSALHSGNNCPCSTAAGSGPQSFVGENYYCESGNSNDINRTYIFGSFYSADKLWDGKQCEGTCCTDSKSPPWFSVHLPNPTTESIEVRICGNEATSNEDTPIELLEIYVQ